MAKSTFLIDLQEMINKYSRENVCDTPDYILADYMNDCLMAFEKAVNARDKWFISKPKGNIL